MFPRSLIALSTVFYVFHAESALVQSQERQAAAIAGLGSNCVTPYGSPCGPIAKCIETDTAPGYACEELYEKMSCPVGCGPKEQCVRDDVTEIYSCQCKEGFHRPISHMPCVRLDQTIEEEDLGQNRKRIRVKSVHAV